MARPKRPPNPNGVQRRYVPIQSARLLVSPLASYGSGSTGTASRDRQLTPVTGNSPTSTDDRENGNNTSHRVPVTQNQLEDRSHPTPTHIPMQEVLVGIERLPWAPGLLEDMQNVRFVSQDSGHESTATRLPASKSPWTPLRFRCGGRNGRLSKEQADHAMAMRSHGNCMKCRIYREKCDKQLTCSICQKRARSWKLPCMRGRLIDRLDCLIPRILQETLQWEHVYKFIKTTAESWHGKRFDLMLTQHMGKPCKILKIQVREAEPLGPELRQTYAALASAMTEDHPTGNVSLASPPLLPDFEDVSGGCQQVLGEVSRWLQEFSQTRKSNWFSHCFDRKEDEAWERKILEIICEYHDASVVGHDQLHVALQLSFLNYIMIHPFVVPDEEVEQLLHHLRNPCFGENPLGDDEEVYPRGVNIFIKMLLYPNLEAVGRQLLANLDSVLFNNKNLAGAARDLTFCQMFLCLTVIAKFQSTLCLYVRIEDTDNEGPLSQKELETQIRWMEDELATTIIELYVCKLRHSLKRKQDPAVDQDTEPGDEHSSSFQFFGRLRQATLEVGENLQGPVDLRNIDPVTFPATNVGRLLRKFYRAVFDTFDASAE